MSGKRKIEVINDVNITRFASYYNVNKGSVEELFKAFNSNDSTLMRETISKHSSEAFLNNLMSIYDATIIEITKKILGNNVDLVDDKSISKDSFKPSVTPPPKKKVSVYKEEEKIEQFQKGSGKSYSRNKPVKWKEPEINFLKNNKDKSNEELVRMFNLYFPNRTNSSIVTKKYRIKK